jgi:hypothetical protein
MRPILLLSSNEVPGGAYKFIVKEPSLNAGRNSLPKNGTTATAAAIKKMAPAIINRGLESEKWSKRSSFFF